jgi:hypothetical protein
MPDMDSAPVILGANAGGADPERGGLTARDDDADFECPRNQPLSFFSELPLLDMALQIFCSTRKWYVSKMILKKHQVTPHWRPCMM